MRIELMDTTLREGAQCEGVEFSLDDKRKIALALEALGVPLIEGGNPAGNPKDAAFFEQARREPFLTAARLVPFGSTCRAGGTAPEDANLQALLHTEQKTLSVFGKASALHVKEVLRVEPQENLRMIEESVVYLTRQGREVYFDAEHFFDGCEADAAYALETVRTALRAGARRVVLCDTNGGGLPERLRARVAQLRAAFPDASFGVHCHDDAGLAVAGTMACVEAGCDHVQGTIAGIGERCGNAHTATLIGNLQLKLGYSIIPPERLPLLTPTVRGVIEVMNLTPNPRAPYVGYSAFAHKGGMHIDGVRKNAATFEHVPPEKVGNQRRLVLSEQAGRSGVFERMKRLLPEIDREDERVRQVTERLKRRENRGYAYESADGSFDLLVLDTLGKRRAFFNVEDFHVISGLTGDVAQAYIKIAVDGREDINAAEGEGPVNALDMALRKALLVFYPSLRQVRLRDFKVRVVDSGGTASTVRVLIESTDGHNVWSTVGVSPNIIGACFKALCDSVEYYLTFVQG